MLSFARVVSWALHHYRVATLPFLVALMAGALRVPAAILGGAVAVGAALVVVHEHTTDSVEY